VDEIIVVDDGSTDHTDEIVRAYSRNYSQLKVINQQNAGVSAARNKGIVEAGSEWILLLDADDECSEGLLPAHVEKLKSATNRECTAMIYTAYQQIDAESQYVQHIFRGHPMTSGDGVCDLFLRNPIISPSGVLLSREKAIEVGLFRHDLKCDEDVELWIRLVEKYNIEYIDRTLSLIRRHDNNTTRSMSLSHQAERELLAHYGVSNIKRLFLSRTRPDIENAIDLCTVLMKLELYQDCIEILQQVQLQPNNDNYQRYLFLYSICHIQINNIDQAVSYTSELLQLNPDHGAALNNRGVLYAIKSDPVQALANLQAALKLYPNYLDAKHNVKLVGQGQDFDCGTAFKYTLRELRPVLMDYTGH
jgi:glycosyltransferase involved in cell wall biosynthesis